MRLQYHLCVKLRKLLEGLLILQDEKTESEWRGRGGGGKEEGGEGWRLLEGEVGAGQELTLGHYKHARYRTQREDCPMVVPATCRSWDNPCRQFYSIPSAARCAYINILMTGNICKRDLFACC